VTSAIFRQRLKAHFFTSFLHCALTNLQRCGLGLDVSVSRRSRNVLTSRFALDSEKISCTFLLISSGASSCYLGLGHFKNSGLIDVFIFDGGTTRMMASNTLNVRAVVVQLTVESQAAP